MKKKWLFTSLYFLLFLTAYANELLSNGEVSFYYQKDEKTVAYLRGDALWPVDISRLRFYWIREEGEPVDLQEKVIKAEKKGQNILELAYHDQDVAGKISFVPSFRSKNQLYLFFNLDVKKKGYFVVEFAPQKDSGYLQKEERGLQYGNFFVTSNREDFDILVARDSSLADFKFETLLNRLKKYRGDRLYYLFRNFDIGKQEAMIRIDFYNKGREDWKSYEETWQEEVGEILSKEHQYALRSSSPIVQKNIEVLDLLTSRVFIPEEISYAKSKQSYLEKQQLLLMRALYGLPENENRILEDINLKKKEIESVTYLYYAFLYAQMTGRRVDQNLVDSRLGLQLLSIYDEMAEDGLLISAEDSIESYVLYDKLISLMESRAEFYSERDYIIDRKKRLEMYIKNNFVEGNNLKDRSFSDKRNAKNIEYVFLFPKGQRKKELQAWYQKYHNKKLGIILYPGETSLDMIHNLKMASLLYQFGMISEADSLLEDLEEYMKRSQNYVLESYPLSRPNGDLEISAKAIYYYLMANLDRERNHGNER